MDTTADDMKLWLTAVAERFVGQWTEFTGGEAEALPCTAEAALAWWARLQGETPG